MAQGSNGGVAQRLYYFPYGKVNNNESYWGQALQPYKFGGKEEEPMFGLGLYDFEARQYDPLYGRFTSMDPLAEKKPWISPYAYCSGNPVNRIDPDGRQDWMSLSGMFYGSNNPYTVVQQHLAHDLAVDAVRPSAISLTFGVQASYIASSKESMSAVLFLR
jgi:RHS repeat-associated protein